MPISVVSRKLKVTTVLDAADFLASADGNVPEGCPARTTLVVKIEARVLRADVASKGIRKVLVALKEHGPENIAVILQGTLIGNDIGEAGISATVKNAPPPSLPAAA
jgi:hypothetical protein